MIEYENLGKFNRPFLDEYKKEFAEIADSGWFVLGNKVSEFEKEFASFCGTQYCIGVASGLDALMLPLVAFDFPKESEVIVPSNTYIATIIAIINAGYKPILVEPDISTYNIDPAKIEEKITAKTKAVMVVHLYGKMCDMDLIVALCRKHDLKLVEDCAQSHGAKYTGKMCSTFGNAAAFSFYPSKNLGALGDAGAVITSDEELTDKLKYLRNYGSKIKYYNEYIGYNSRLDELQAAFLSIKLKKLNDITEHKRLLAKIYSDNLKSDFITPVIHPDFYDVYHIYNVRHEKRDKLREYLLNNNIRTEIHYPVSPNKQKGFQNIFGNISCPISEEIHATTLSLPISYFHSPEDIYRVVEVMNKF